MHRILESALHSRMNGTYEHMDMRPDVLSRSISSWRLGTPLMDVRAIPVRKVPLSEDAGYLENHAMLGGMGC